MTRILLFGLVALLGACSFSKEIPPDAVGTGPLIGFEKADSSADEKSSRHNVLVRLSEPSTKIVSISYQLDTSGTAASPTEDYELVTSGTIEFAPGVTEQTIVLRILPDVIQEPDETIDIVLVEATNALISPTGREHRVTILAKALPRVSITAASSAEEPMPQTIDVTLDEVSEFPITVGYTVGGTATTADHSLAPAMLTIPANTKSINFNLVVLDDALDENDETVVITLVNPTNAFLDDIATAHTHTILDGIDPPPTIQFATTATPIAEGGTMASVLLQLSAVSGRAISVPFTTNVGSTAAVGAGNDYTITTTSPITIPAGTATTTIVVVINNDTGDEPAETIILDMGQAMFATNTGNQQHTITIADDDLVCYGPPNSNSDVCLDTAPTETVTLNGGTINTNTGSADCSPLAIDFGPNQDAACFIVGGTINVNGSYAVTGSRRLVLVAASAINIDGTLDASSKQSGQQGAGSNSNLCANGTNPEGDNNGGGGGAGGSFMGAGANGGNGESLATSGGVAATADAAPPTRLRGGCAGQKGGNSGGGVGGRGGGAVYLVSGNTISFGNNGQINVSGAGANGGSTDDGGGGGGSGGMIHLYATMTLSVNPQAELVANGGGGGGGGNTTSSGGAGTDPVPSTPSTPAGGGTGANPLGGDGGNGFAGTTSPTPGDNGNVTGGGGGGGGGGFILSNKSLGNLNASAGAIMIVP